MDKEDKGSEGEPPRQSPDRTLPRFDSASEVVTHGSADAAHPKADASPAAAALSGLQKAPETTATQAASPAAGSGQFPSRIFSPNQLVASRYRVARFIGAGGMGEVYEAEDIELSERVALKTIRPDIAGDERAIDRFKREIHLARQVSHPNVCRIFDLGYHDVPGSPPQSRITFLTMELLGGETLAERLERSGRMSTAEALPIIRQMAAALDAAHRAGIIHRDFKSPNVMLVPQVTPAPRPVASEATNQAGQTPPSGGELPGATEELRAVVTDFGLARSTSLEETTRSLTGGGVMGTPAYMAPEQVEGGEITPAVDIYALGVVMYEMLTGAQPFVADTPLAVAVKRLKEPPAPPRAQVQDLDPVWEAVILRCLERDPADRFVDVKDVVKALAGEEVAIGKRALEEQKKEAQAERRRRRLRWALTAGVVVILFVSALAYHLHVTRKLRQGAPVASLPTGPIKVRRSVAVLGFKNLAGRPDVAWLSTALSEMLSTELGAGEELRVISGENVARMKIDLSLPDDESFAQDTLVKIRKNLGSDLVVLGSYIDLGKESGGQIRLDFRVQDTAAGETLPTVSESGTEEQLFALVSKAGATLRKELGVGTLSASDASSVQASLPSSPEAARLYAEGLAKSRLFDALAARGLLEKAVLAEPQHALAHSALAAAWSALGYDAKATEEAKKAFDLSTNLPREERLWVEGRYWETAKNWEKAVEIYRTLWIFSPDNLDYGLLLADAQTSARKAKDALATIESLRTAPPPARDDPRIDLAEARAADALGDFKREQLAAARAATKAEALSAGLLIARAKRSEGLALYNLGEFQKALALYDEAKRIYAAAGDRGGAAWVVNNSANVVFDQGDPASARKMYEEALTIWQEIGDKGGMAAAQNNIADVYLAEGDLAAAKRMYEKTVAICRETNSKTVMEVALSNIGVVRCKQGDLAGAKQIYGEALADSREIGDEAGVAVLLIDIASVLRLQGDLGGATTTYEEATAVCRKIGEDSYRANVLAGMGDVLTARGDLIGAQKRYEEALAINNQVGEKGASADIRLALAQLAIEGGHPAAAEAPTREASDEFRQEKATDSEISADIVLARALLEQGKYPAAQEAIDRAKQLLNKSEDLDAHFSFRITAARVRQASGRPSDRREAAKSLEAVLGEAKKTGFLGHELEAGLALGEIELQSGNTAQARSRLEALEKQATAQGFGLIARKAAAALGRKPQT